MTKEELREHCEKQVKACEMWAKHRGQAPSGKVYEEHKLILELLEENEDWQDYIDKANQTNSRLVQVIERHKMQQPSEDCISRAEVQKFVSYIQSIKDSHNEQDTPINYGTICDIVIRGWKLMELPSVTPVQKWIPVSERLPENEGLYLVSVENDHLRHYSKTAWFTVHKNWFSRQDVIAWQPLPESYKEKR